VNRRQLESLLTHRSARDPLVRTVRDAARRLGAEAWLVGGFVRDAALCRPATDVDLIAGRRAARLIEELRRSWSTGGFRFRKRGVTTWRFRVDSRETDVVDASRRGLERDLERRDFTVNAIAFDLRDGLLVDPLNGLRDLQRRTLRLPRENVVREDPVRALRAARFLAQLPRFTLEASAHESVSAAGPALRRAAGERVGLELDKLLAAEAPVRGLQALSSFGLLASVLPELVPMRSCRAGAERPDVWTQTLATIEHACRPGRLPGAAAVRTIEGRRLLRWALLVHDIAKPETLAFREDGRPTFHGHEGLGAESADRLLRRLRLRRDDRKRIARLVRNHLRPSLLAEAGAPDRGMRRLVRESADDLPLLIVHAACDALGSGAPDSRVRWPRLRRTLVELERSWRARRAVRLPRIVDGRDVMRATGLEPGPRVGKMLERVRDLQEQGRLQTRAEALAWLTGRR